MGMNPQDFYRMEIEDYILKSNGYVNSRIWLEEKIRRAAGLIQAPHIDKRAPSIMDQWPIANDKKNRQRAIDYVNEKNLEVLKAHKQGGFEYVLESGKIITKKISLN